MVRALTLLLLAGIGTGAHAREIVDASVPEALSVTVYRDPERGPGEEMDRDLPRGFAMISETRSVTLPPGESTIRFEGVAEGMVAVTAIVTGLPGGLSSLTLVQDVDESLLGGLLGGVVNALKPLTIGALSTDGSGISVVPVG